MNDASLVVRMGFAGRCVLFSGDIEEQGEAELVAGAGGGPATDLLKVPHHGSRTSSADELLAAVRPGLAVASLAAGNRYGFPRPEVSARYQRRGVRLLRTDRDGAVTFRIEPGGEFTSLACGSVDNRPMPFHVERPGAGSPRPVRPWSACW